MAWAWATCAADRPAPASAAALSEAVNDTARPVGSESVTGLLWAYAYPLDCIGSAMSSTGSAERNRPTTGS